MNGAGDKNQLILDLMDEVEALKLEVAARDGRIAELEDRIQYLEEREAGASV